MNRILCISQRIIKTEHEIQFSLSNEWTELFNKYKDISILPLHDNTNLKELSINFNIAGVIISGGNNIYQNNSNYYSNDNFQSKIRDDFEIKLIKFSLENKIPLMGVCRGCQLLAYVNGYKIVNTVGHVATEHKLIINKQSKYLSQFLDKTKLVNSYHDYGIEYNNHENENIVVTCLSEDNNIEALEYKNDKILGIMWHPERNTSENYYENINLISSFFNLEIKN